MSTFTLRRAFVALACVACAGAVSLAQAAPMSFSVRLQGTDQVPAVTTNGTGKADLTYDRDAHKVTWDITPMGLSSAVTMAHFHGPAEAGKNAPPVIWLTKKGSTSTPITGDIKGEATLTKDQEEDFLAGKYYINVHTRNYPDGEIRGQVMPPKY